MRQYYYWYDKMPEPKELNRYTKPDVFFSTLLAKENDKIIDKYSTIEKLDEADTRSIRNKSYSYGFDFSLYNIGSNKVRYYARVLYVVKDSPADEAGLKRGDWIAAVNDIPINQQNYENLYAGRATRFTLGVYVPEHYEGEEKEAEKIEPTETIDVDGARAVVENPIQYSNIYQVGGKNIGYLVYTHFTSGTGQDDYTYDDELSLLSNEFKANNVSEFILDLRYNPGGNIPPAQLLCSMLVPEKELGKVMSYIEFNDKNTNQNTSEHLTRQSLRGGSNLNLSRVFILTTSYTASASELLINALTPYMEVIIIGSKTEGKNVGSTKFTDSENKYPWAIHPIVCKIYNSEKESNYSQGFTPTHLFNEFSYYTPFLPFGDPDELLLGIALRVIAGTYPPEKETTTSSVPVPVYSSLEKKAVPGVIMEVNQHR